MRDVFLTGATGTIGSALVPRLLQDPETTLTLLVRARDAADLERRMTDMRLYWGIAEGSAQDRRIRALQGDISSPAFGLSPASFEDLAARTSHVIHCAASVKLNMSLDQARATAVTPVRTVLDFGRRAAASGCLKKLDLVSTVGVWGRTPGVMPEQQLPGVSEFHNTYEAAKAEAERVVWTEGGDLPITVHRPSMVVGERANGRVIHFQVFYHLCEFLSGARTFGIMPGLGHTRLDTVPVDWVADAICWSSREPRAAGRIFHLCSGPQLAIALPRLQQRVRDAWQAQGRPVPALRTVNRRLLAALVPIIGAFTGTRTRRALRGLSPVLAYLGENQGFSNTESAQALADAGLPVPPVDGYLDQVLAYYLEARSASGAAA